MDTIIYAVIAIVVLARLWSILGRRNEEDNKERSNPFAAPPLPPVQETDDESFAGDRRPLELPPLLRGLKVAPDSLAGGLEQIKKLDPAFDEKQFLQGARVAFAQIIDDFAKGDLSRTARLLSPEVLAHFEAAIAARRDEGQTVECKLENLKEAETAAARVDGKRAIITVRFISMQQNVLRDSAGRIIGGEEGKVEEIIDTWVFARDTSSSDPNWMLVETKS